MGVLKEGRRRKILIDPKIQIAPTLMGLGFIAAVTLFLFLPLLETMRSVDVLLEGKSEGLIRYYKTQQTSTIVSIGLFLGGVLGLWTASMLWRTHKIAGPIVKITRHIHQFAAGNFASRIQLRDHDQMQGLASAVNGMADSLQERDQVIQRAVLAQIDSARQAVSDAHSPERAAAVLDRLADNIRGNFEIGPESPSFKEGAEQAKREDAYSQSPAS
jgi:methyl-accepting chemotaxis protein